MYNIYLKNLVYYFRHISTSVDLNYNVKLDKPKSSQNSKSPKSQKNIVENVGKSISSEELLEKLIAGLSSDIHQKNRVYKNDLMRVINKIKEIKFSTKRQGLLLLRCCTELLPDEAPFTRMSLAEEIWNTIK